MHVCVEPVVVGGLWARLATLTQAVWGKGLATWSGEAGAGFRLLLALLYQIPDSLP